MRMGSFLNWRNPMAICSLPLQQLQPAHTAFVHFWQQGKEDFQARLSRKASWVHTPSSLSWTWQRHELAGTHDTLPCLWRCCALLLSFLMLLWSDNISKYPVLEGKFLQKTWSSLGVPLEGASTIHIYICLNMQPMLFVWAAHMHATHLLFHWQHMTWEYDWIFNSLPFLPHMVRWPSQ